MFVDGHRSGRDDLLFYVMYDHNEDRDTVEFTRRDSKTLPRYTGTCTGIYTQCIHSGAPWVLSWLCARQSMHTCTCSSAKKLKRPSWGHLLVWCHQDCFNFVFGVVHVQCRNTNHLG